ncbi:chemotaxis protein CheB [Rhodococcoides kyotonense]|uniref:protein-glutamate methylesterase n=1 Tax=Rhodococcoides kyotonense TaxID=398843 RepID=A0A239J754_9NOCA|nr:chemotaxis protein CheB [Rhodococcus kyotonensis]SNT01083.1 two-component system, chemotaxis family, response regulator CheB [Rhodococcus kyotonensis]
MPESSTPSVVAVGASAGGVEALTAFVAHLPRDFPHAVLVTLHMPAHGTSALAHILDRSGLLTAVTAESGMHLQPGVIYAARPDRHLLVHDGTILLSDGPTESGHRPSINALFRSVALHSGPRGIGVLLSGVGDDGVEGLAAIAERGGVTVAQHPDDAVYPTLPCNAIDAITVDHVLPVGQIGPKLATLVIPPVDVAPPQNDRLKFEDEIARSSRYERGPTGDNLGSPSGYVCPDCGGALIAVDDNNNYRCHIGHGWTGAALLDAQDDRIEQALSIALRSLHERIHLATSLAVRAKAGALQDKYRKSAHEARTAADTLSAALKRT